VADLVETDQVEALVQAVEGALGPIDIVVNNAGMVQTGHDEPSRLVHEIPDSQWRRGMDINITTVFKVTRAVVPGMIERRYGRIVNMSSVTGPVVSNPKATIYSAAKAGIMGMTRAQAIELAEYNITVNGIGPGWIETPSSSPEEIFAGKQAPIGRPGTADEIGTCGGVPGQRGSELRDGAADRGRWRQHADGVQGPGRGVLLMECRVPESGTQSGTGARAGKQRNKGKMNWRIHRSASCA
jgi:NAD(P)-dependent dehydrogenase (short-subunit alcohol dehydrogenase family)